MRTSITLDDDVYELAHIYAGARGLTLGAAVSELVRKSGNVPEAEVSMDGLKRLPNGMLVFAARPGRRITTEMAKQYQDDEIE